MGNKTHKSKIYEPNYRSQPTRSAMTNGQRGGSQRGGLPKSSQSSTHGELDDIENDLNRMKRQNQPNACSSLLSYHEQTVLVKSWSHMNYRNSLNNRNIGVKIYLKLFSKYPELKAVFGFDRMTAGQIVYEPKFLRQADNFIRVIDDVLNHLDDLEGTVQPSLFALGGRHVKKGEVGFKLQHWDLFAETMLECFIETQGIHKHRETTSLWRALISWIIDVMKDGYYYTLRSVKQEKHQQERNLNNDVIACPPGGDLGARASSGSNFLQIDNSQHQSGCDDDDSTTGSVNLLSRSLSGRSKKSVRFEDS